MATMTVSLPDPMTDWIDVQVRSGGYASASDYMHDLVRRDRAQREQEFTLEELRRKLARSREGEVSERSVSEIFAEARQIAGTSGLRGE